VALPILDFQPSGTSQPGLAPQQEGILVTPGTQNNTAARLQVAFQFYANVSQAGSLSDKVGSPASSLPTRSADLSWVLCFQHNPQWALFYPNALSYQGGTNFQVPGNLDQLEPPTQQWSQAAKNQWNPYPLQLGLVKLAIIRNSQKLYQA